MKTAKLLSASALVLLALISANRPACGADRLVEAGMLTVYTGTSVYNSGDILYYPHTDYRIFHADGHFYRWVRNHMTATDETPYRIVIPVGDYFILAKSEKEGGVKVPISIAPGEWTVVRLDDPTRHGRIPRGVDVIRLPGGAVAGWQFKKRAPRGFLDSLDGSLLDVFSRN